MNHVTDIIRNFCVILKILPRANVFSFDFSSPPAPPATKKVLNPDPPPPTPPTQFSTIEQSLFTPEEKRGKFSGPHLLYIIQIGAC